MINYWCLLLLPLFFVYYLLRNKVKFYFSHPCLANIRTTSRRFVTWQNIMLAACVFMLLAACDINYKSKQSLTSLMVHKYVLVNDGSGSMVENNKPNGIGESLKAVLDGNNKLFEVLGKRNDGSKDFVGAIAFADDAFIVSYLTDDLQFVKSKLNRIDYRLPPMNGGTDIQSGLWSSIAMILQQNLKENELNRLELKFYGTGDKLDLDSNFSNNFNGSSIIIFTDGLFVADGSSNTMSAYKLLRFCKLCGIRVYFISVFELNEKIKIFCHETGGKGIIVNKFNDLQKVYEEIAKSQANEYIVKTVDVDRSLSRFFGILGLGFGLVSFVFKSIFVNYAEV